MGVATSNCRQIHIQIRERVLKSRAELSCCFHTWEPVSSRGKGLERETAKFGSILAGDKQRGSLWAARFAAGGIVCLAASRSVSTGFIGRMHSPRFMPNYPGLTRDTHPEGLPSVVPREGSRATRCAAGCKQEPQHIGLALPRWRQTLICPKKGRRLHLGQQGCEPKAGPSVGGFLTPGPAADDTMAGPCQLSVVVDMV